MGPVLDGVSEHMADYDQDKSFVVAEQEPCDVVKVLKESGAEILINYLPVGSENAVRFYAEACLEANVGFINAMPVSSLQMKTGLRSSAIKYSADRR